MTKTALIIGGTRGIGQATADVLRARGWRVETTGRKEFDVFDYNIKLEWRSLDVFVFCAGSINAREYNAFSFPLAFFKIAMSEVVKPNGVIVAVSSVAADRPAKVDPHYAAAKAALESYARTVADSDMAKAHGWRVEIIRFDLVQTDMLKQLPPETLVGRTIITKEEAAQRIWRRIEGTC